MQNAQDVIHIAFTVNDNYVKYLAVTIASILSHAGESDKFFFHILHGGDISEESKEQLFSLQNIQEFIIEFSLVQKNLFTNQAVNLCEHVTRETNYRFSVASLFPSLDKLIFLDADLIVVGSLIELWKLDITPYYMAACPMLSFERIYVENLGITPDHLYYNTGVTIFNLKKWRQDKIEEQLFFNAEKYRHLCMFLDQDILCSTLQKSILPLPKIWNSIAYLGEIDDTSKIYHWAGAEKPWNSLNVPYAEKYVECVKKTPYENEILSVLKKLKREKKIKQFKEFFFCHKKFPNGRCRIYILGIRIWAYTPKTPNS